MKYLKKYENPDNLYYEKIDKELDWSTDGAYAFGYFKKGSKPNLTTGLARRFGGESNELDRNKVKDNFVLSYENGFHPELRSDFIIDKEKDDSKNEWDDVASAFSFDYPGRIWSNEKIISFWEFPETKEKLDEIISYINELSSFKIDDSWQIEVYDGKIQKLSKWGDNSTHDKREEGRLIPISEYKGSNNPDPETYKIHLMKAAEKNKALKDMGAKPKVKNWKEWQKPFEGKVHEIADYIVVNDKDVKHRDKLTFPFAITDDYVIVGDESSMHGNRNYYTKNVSVDWQKFKTYQTRGRMFLEHKIISFWNTEDIKNHIPNILKDLQEELNKGDFIARTHVSNNKHTPIKDTKYSKYLPINFLDGWKIDYGPVSEYDYETTKFDKYEIGFSYYLLVPVKDFYKLRNIEIDDELSELLKKYHVATGAEKEKLAKELGLTKYPMKVKNWKEWQKPFESSEYKSNMQNIDYVAISYDYKGKPILYVTKFVVQKVTDDKVECKIKGYQYTDIKIEGGSKKGWVNVNDFETKNTHIILKKDFKVGNSRRKVYDITI